MNARPRIAVVGSFNTDLLVRTPRMPLKGETILGGDYQTGPGGKGANQAVAAARLDADVTMVVKLGADDLGDRAKENLLREGVHPEFILRTDVTHTGVAFIIVDDEGENMIVVAPGANEVLTSEDVEAAREMIASSQVLLVQLEVPLETVATALRIAHEAGVRTLLNPAPGQPLNADLLRMVDVLTPNETEAQIISGHAISDLAEAEAAARSLLAVGVGCVVVTLGASGALIVSTDGTRHIQGQQVDVVDTTGAGDAFSGALAVAVAEGRSIVDAVTFANAAAALQVTKVGTAPAMPYRLEVEAFLERGLAPSHTLEVFHGDTLVFSSDSNWLHPLFELEAFLESSTYNPGGLEVYDKIVGRAAALLMVRLGVGQVHARVLSELGREILQYHDMTYTYDEVVDRIACDTEALLREVLDPEAAYVMLRERAGRGE